MSGGRLPWSALTLAVGYAAAAALIWAFLNVPESTVLALFASLLLAVLVVVLTGLTTAAAVALLHGVSGRTVIGHATAALPAFVIGIATLGALWWLTATADGVWSRYRGEIDATLLRYLGVTRTEPLHLGERWLTWTVRWGLGLSVVAALISAGCLNGIRATGRGFRTAISVIPLAAATLGAVAVMEGLWRLAAWRPQRLPPSSAEVVFVAAKLGLLYLLFVGIAIAVLDVHRRAAQRALIP